jgi:hypothetical protein
MNFKNVDMESVIRRVAERRIEEGMREGKFDHLAGEGKPLDLEPMPASEDARLLWWALRLMKQNDVVPNDVRWRKQLDGLRERIDAVTGESGLKALVAAYNQIVRQVNSHGVGLLPAPVTMLSLEEELRKLRERGR